LEQISRITDPQREENEMKKRVLAGVVGAMFVCSVGFAAPVVDLQKGESTFGITHSNLKDSDDIKYDSKGYYIQHGVSDNLVLGIDMNKQPDFDWKVTDIYGQYKAAKNTSIILGNRQYKGDESENKLLYGIAANTKLNEKTTGYASVLKTSFETQWTIGANYDISENIALDVNYKKSNFDEDYNEKGFGFGVSYKF
jgi:opacity protein-like surface antigen